MCIIERNSQIEDFTEILISDTNNSKLCTGNDSTFKLLSFTMVSPISLSVCGSSFKSGSFLIMSADLSTVFLLLKIVRKSSFPEKKDL